MAGSQRTRSKQKQQQAKQDGKRKRQSDVKQAEASPAACVRQLSENLPDLGELVPGECCWVVMLAHDEGGMTPTQHSSKACYLTAALLTCSGFLL